VKTVYIGSIPSVSWGGGRPPELARFARASSSAILILLSWVMQLYTKAEALLPTLDMKVSIHAP
jgi:hypothetical protein